MGATIKNYAAYEPELRLLRPYIRPGARALDIGAATGDFLTFLRSHGMTGMGIDPNPERVAAARQAGENVRLGKFTRETASQFAVHSFDLISFRESFYYIDDQEWALETARWLLAPGGAVYIKSHVPNSPYYWGGIDKMRRVGPACTRFLTKRQMVDLLKAHDFRITGTDRISLSAQHAAEAWGMSHAAINWLLQIRLVRGPCERLMRFLPPDRVMIMATRKVS